MKKYLPFILLGVGIVVLIVVFLIVKKNKQVVPTEKEDITVTLSLNERPVASLTPSADGHWLKLSLSKILASAASMDYELLYQLPDGRTGRVYIHSAGKHIEFQWQCHQAGRENPDRSSILAR